MFLLMFKRQCYNNGKICHRFGKYLEMIYLIKDSYVECLMNSQNYIRIQCNIYIGIDSKRHKIENMIITQVQERILDIISLTIEIKIDVKITNTYAYTECLKLEKLILKALAK